jgi:hypothetical protein
VAEWIFEPVWSAHAALTLSDGFRISELGNTANVFGEPGAGGRVKEQRLPVTAQNPGEDVRCSGCTAGSLIPTLF